MVRYAMVWGQDLTNIVAVKEELVAKLQNEITMEEDQQEDEDLSTNIKEYLENSPFEVYGSHIARG
jgi:chromosome condensin MukBEF complex kleisin-like MukF subunit